jgi:hypothetical protein
MDTLPPMPANTSAIETRIAALEAEVRELERSNTNSPKFWTRAFAIVGHQFAVIGIFYLVLLVVALAAAAAGNY